MQNTTSANLYSGWLGIGTAFSADALIEPLDAAYGRRPFVFGPLFNGRSSDLFPGSIGPAATPWGTLLFAGLFDSPGGGNLLLCWPLARPVTIAAGQTWTSNGALALTLSADTTSAPSAVRTWVAGAQFGTVGGAALVATACQNLQVCNGLLSMLPTGASAPTQSLSNLPTVAPVAGSGQLWNNGGVICIA